MGGRTRVHEALQNDRRRAIYDAVRAEPGIHLRELQRRTGLRWSALQYHTGVLLREGLLAAARSGKSRVLACDVHRLSSDQIKALHFLRRPREHAVARAVAAHRGATQRDLAAEARVHFRLVSDYLRQMEALGLVRTQDGRPKHYAATPRLLEALARVEGRK